MALMACALAFTGASTALADGPPSSQSAELLSPVVGHALNELVESHTVVEWGAFSPPDARRIWEIYCEGRYIMTGTRVPIHGTYSIEENAVCMTGEIGGATHCHRYFLDTAGQVFRQSVEQGGRAPIRVEVAPVEC